MEIDLATFAKKALSLNASDIHFQTGDRPLLRVNGKVVHLKFDEVTDDHINSLKEQLLDDRLREQYERRGAADFSYSIDEICRMRVNVAKCHEGCKIVTRIIPNAVPTFEKFNMPEIFSTIAEQLSGFVILGGLTGSGKSTTLAAMLEHINNTSSRHIVTIEDPIEFLHTPKKSIFTRREIGTDVPSFANGLRTAFRQDPDVILVGEMRDPETMRAAIQAAETGHLVLATVHSRRVEDIPERIIGTFPEDEQNQVRTELAMVSHAFISQQLPPTMDGKNRVSAWEILVLNNAARHMIRDEKSYNLPSVMQTQQAQGMITMTESLIRLYENKVISKKALVAYATDADRVRTYLEEN